MIPHNATPERKRVEHYLQLIRQHDPGLYSHSILVSELAKSFACQLGFTPMDRNRLARAALLHDIGKLRIGVGLLRKPEALNPAETWRYALTRKWSSRMRGLAFLGGWEGRHPGISRQEDHNQLEEGVPV